MPETVVIAIDGTAACGKGTLARRLARHYGFAHLDSGALYRLVGLSVLEAGGEPSREADAVRGDAADRARPIAPLKQAGDAILLDTSDLGIDAAFAAALALVDPRIAPRIKE